MSKLQTIIGENQKERERLLAFMAGLSEKDFSLRLPNGWSVSVTLVHLAFWDLRQATLLNRWLVEKLKPSAIPASIDAQAVNDPLSILSESIPFPTAVKLAADAAERVDQIVEQLTPAQADELIQMGFERNIRRSVHRKDHLDKMEKAMKK